MADSSEHQAKVDPELERQLEESPADALVDVVFFLQPASGIPPASEVEEQVARLVERVESKSGVRTSELNVFPNLASFVVRATPELIEGLLQQPEVAAAVANRSEGSTSPS